MFDRGDDPRPHQLSSRNEMNRILVADDGSPSSTDA